MIKITIADDQILLRKSLGQILSTDKDIHVIDMVSNGQEAINSCKMNKPDILLMDIEMPEMDGITALRKIKDEFTDIKVIILTTFENSENIVESFLAEADGYITKDIDCDELIATIKCVDYGLTVIHESVKRIMVSRFKKLSNENNDYTDVLSSEEIEMVKHIISGQRNKDIASKFNYTEGTIKNKVSRIYEKLGVTDRVQLAVYAVEHGME